MAVLSQATLIQANVVANELLPPPDTDKRHVRLRTKKISLPQFALVLIFL